MAYQQKGLLDRSLTDNEEAEFRKYAQENDPPDIKKWELYHPICREEWMKRGVNPLKGSVKLFNPEIEREKKRYTADEIVSMISDALAESDGYFIQRIANKVLSKKVKYIEEEDAFENFWS